MRIQNSKFKVQDSMFKPKETLNRLSLLLCAVNYLLLTVLFLITFYSSPVNASDKWAGIDESVVEKFAKEHGREAREPFINTDQGDLLLFVFLVAGAAGGFMAGYYWRILLEKREKQ